MRSSLFATQVGVTGVVGPANLGDDPHDASCIAFLGVLGAAQVAHSGRTLEQHLVGTYRILRGWRCPARVCLAGLYHSVYGTPAFAHRLTSDRHAIRLRIGAAAEALVFEFSRLHRGSFVDSLARASAMDNPPMMQNALPYDEHDCSALAHVFVANELELARNGSFEIDKRRRIAARIVHIGFRMRRFVGDAALESLRQLLVSPMLDPLGDDRCPLRSP